KILHRDCEAFRLKVLESTGDNFQTWTITVWLDKTLQLNKDVYADWKEGHWDVISGLNGGMYLKMTTSNNFMTITHNALTIEPGEPDKSLFEFDKEKAIKID